ncbi:MAG: DUF192 domain-containing protein [Spirochaetales bacterium]|nr:DUF192 domain-containing protein [Spirochaetales bacterium]
MGKVLLALVLAVPLLCGCASKLERIEVEIGGEPFLLEVARTEEEKRTGLMDRNSLGEREGMIFVYEDDQHLAFWMKNTPIPLTLAFLSKDGEILQIEELKPFSLKSVVSERAARYALELPRGALAELGVEVGDRIALPPELP